MKSYAAQDKHTSFVWDYCGFMPDFDGYTCQCETLLLENSQFAKSHGGG